MIKPVVLIKYEVRFMLMVMVFRDVRGPIIQQQWSVVCIECWWQSVFKLVEALVIMMNLDIRLST